MTQQVKDLALALLWLRALLWLGALLGPGFYPWPGNFRMLWAWPKEKERFPELLD